MLVTPIKTIIVVRYRILTPAYIIKKIKSSECIENSHDKKCFSIKLYKLQKIDETIIDKNIYELFYKLISIHTNNENSLKDDTLKKLFAKELSTQLNQDIQEEDLSDIQFEVIEIMGYKQGVFSVTIKNKSYGRFSNIWKETVSQ